MVRHRRMAQGLVALGCLAAATAAAAQTAAVDTLYHLHGTVVNGLTGKPLPRALVSSPDRRLATMTDSDGHFRLDISLPPPPPAPPAGGGGSFGGFAGFGNGNQLYLAAQKPGFMPSNQPTSFALDATLDSADAVIKLMPSAGITGRVSASGEDSAGNVQVLLLSRQTDGDGHRAWLQTGGTSTDSRGVFHFSNLRPGDYVLMTGEWRGGDNAAPEPRDAVTERYAPVFNGDSTSLEAAPRLHLGYGDAAQTEFHLHLVRYVPVHIPVNTTESSRRGISARLVDSVARSGGQIAYNSRTNAVEGSLPAGHYNLMLTAFSRETPAYALVPLNVGNVPLTIAPVTLSPSVPIEVRVHTQFIHQQTSQVYDGPLGGRVANQRSQILQLSLRPADGIGSVATSAPAAEANSNELTIPNAPPGRYTVHAQVYQGYAAAITCGGVDLLAHPLVVGAGGAACTIDVTVRDDFAIVTATIASSNAPLPPRTFVFFFPTSPAGQVAMAYGSGDGHFSTPNLAPGSYRAVAFRSPPRMQFAYRDAEAMRMLEDKGIALTVNAGQKTAVTVPLLDDETEAKVEAEFQ